MWLATRHGFFSIVQKAAGEYHVRGRFRKDLENLLHLTGMALEIREWPGADYRYRIIVEQRELVDIMAALALDLDYPNFKNQIARSPDQLAKLSAFHDIWEIMAQLGSRQPEAGTGDFHHNLKG